MKNMLAGASIRDAGADRRVRVGYRAGHRRRHRRSRSSNGSAGQRLLRGDHDPLCQHQILCVEHRGHRQRRHDVRRAEYPAAVPARNRASRAVRSPWRSPARSGCRRRLSAIAGEKAGSDHINLEKQLREIARDKHYWEQKRDRIRLTDRKVEELEQTYAEQLAKHQVRSAQEILKKAKQEAQRLIADANKSDREYDQDHPRSAGREGADAAGAPRAGRLPRCGRAGRYGREGRAGGP